MRRESGSTTERSPKVARRLGPRVKDGTYREYETGRTYTVREVHVKPGSDNWWLDVEWKSGPNKGLTGTLMTLWDRGHDTIERHPDGTRSVYAQTGLLPYQVLTHLTVERRVRALYIGLLVGPAIVMAIYMLLMMPAIPMFPSALIGPLLGGLIPTVQAWSAVNKQVKTLRADPDAEVLWRFVVLIKNRDLKAVQRIGYDHLL